MADRTGSLCSFGKLKGLLLSQAKIPIEPVLSLNVLKSMLYLSPPHLSGPKRTQNRRRLLCLHLILDKIPLMFNNKAVLSAGYLPRTRKP